MLSTAFAFKCSRKLGLFSVTDEKASKAVANDLGQDFFPPPTKKKKEKQEEDHGNPWAL